MTSLEYRTVLTKPFEGQKPGTSGLRKPTKVFMQHNYTENFIYAILKSANSKGKTLVVGGDGRFYGKEACAIILSLCAGFGVSKVIIGKDGILSTPAVSCLIRKYATVGGIILTASHNPGGLDADFGIKFNTSNGGPAPESITNQIYTQTLGLTEYRTCPKVVVDLSEVGKTSFATDAGTFEVEVIDPVEDYAELMEEVFDFGKIRKFLDGGKGFKITLNSLNGVMGPYVKEILCNRLSVPITDVYGCVPLPDFGGRHPDPNLTYASDLVDLMSSPPEGVAYDMGVAFDGDGDRNMILGSKGFFVSPCDSLAVLAANISCVPYFKTNPVTGFARSMPTAAAVDRVAERKKVPVYVVPTGWKYFGSLMDAGKLSLCGEESFGTGSDHIREKDGLWTVLAWLSILAEKNTNIETLVKQHWMEYGRNYFTRYDYENIDVEPADLVMERLESLIFTKSFIGKIYKESICGCKPIKIEDMFEFTYTDPVNGSVSNNQGTVISFTDGSRIIFRKGGTGSTGATIRMYIDSYVEDRAIIYEDAQETLKPFIDIAMDISQLKAITGREKPDVIT